MKNLAVAILPLGCPGGALFVLAFICAVCSWGGLITQPELHPGEGGAVLTPFPAALKLLTNPIN